MKILFVTNYISIGNASGGFINDFINDASFYGLRELYGNSVVDSTKIPSLYSEYKGKIPKQNLWGGMTMFWLIDNDDIDRSNIEHKIKNKYFDIIIYGAIKRCKDYYDLVTQYYPNDRIICIDGNDESELDNLYLKHLYFKRELHITHPNLRPMSCSIPGCKIATKILEKTQEYGTVIPGQRETYIFTDEQTYYDDYNKSYYGVTTKKAVTGWWESMRTLEILANRCIPYFPELENCPESILSHLPKKLLLEGRELAHNFNESRYKEIQEELFEYTKKYLTTKAMAQYLMDEINKQIK
jgi:hypothetical protein